MTETKRRTAPRKSRAPRILVGCPTYDGKRYCLQQYAACVKSLSYPAYDILLVDNSITDDYLHELQGLGVPVIKGPHLPNPASSIATSRNLLRDYAIKNGYDYLLSMEQDVIAPKDIIERLLAHKKSYVTTIVMHRKIIQGRPILFPMVCVPMENRPDRVRPVRMSEIQAGKLFPIASAHLSCTLISVELLKQLTFRHTEKAYDDVIFCNDARALGITLFCDPTIEILHWPDNNDKRASTQLTAREGSTKTE